MRLMLVATDGSEGAGRAVDYAAALAGQLGANLLIVNVIGGDALSTQVFRSFSRAQQTWVDELLDTISAEALAKARERAQAAGAGTIRLESRRGETAPAIIEIAREEGAEVIIAGKRGNGQIAGLLLGSISQKLISLAPLPVTIVP